ncbi:MAG: 2-oxoacid:acceptor oxidoreductase family protein [Gammaproteobacteria bacterium]|jgi:pyruvate ferredoxin oxidoreductase gamma subunit
MFRIRFHGRGGQGMKTASRILGTAFFLEGYEVQDAPRYGAERRGAPIFAFVRADKNPINERGVINLPDLVVVADDSLVPVPAAGVLQGIRDNTVILINSHDSHDIWQHRLNIKSPIVILPETEQVEDRAELRYIGATCAGAATSLVGVISKDKLEQAIQDELGHLGKAVVDKNTTNALAAFNHIEKHVATKVTEGEAISAQDYTKPQWIDFPFEDARVSAPTIHAGLTSVEVNTGLWRTMRPIIDYDLCKGCWWVCSTFCPDGAINVKDDLPEIDYDHCKGCLVCVAQCPPHAIAAVPETQAIEQEKETQGASS